MLRTSETINEIVPAIIAFQKEVEPAKKDGQNSHRKTKYPTLTSIFEAIRAPLARHNLAVIQAPIISEGRVILTTRIIHKSCEWIENELSMKPAEDTAQSIGSSITYARRYSLAPLLGVVAEEDDDGEAASVKAPIPPRQESEQKPKQPQIDPTKIFDAKDPKWLERIEKYFNEKGIAADVRDLVINDLHGKHINLLSTIIGMHCGQGNQ